jgi:hypothetical protein
LEISDGAIFVGNVVVGQSGSAGGSSSSGFRPVSAGQSNPMPMQHGSGRMDESGIKPKSPDVRVPANS